MSGSDSPPTTPRPSLVRRLARNPFVNLVAAFVVLALIQTFLVRLYYVPSGSMENTLDIGDRILVNRLAYLGSEPTSGDVIVFNATEAWDGETAPETNPLKAAVKWLGGIVGIGPSDQHTLVKRVIAGPGQTVSCCDAEGRVLVDGEPLDEPYVFENLPFELGALDCDTTPASLRCFGEYTVPEGGYFVLGDHRSASSDSIALCRGAPETTDACVRLVDSSGVVGRVFQIVFPFGRFGSV
ncbi:signal peptidase I [Herbiconiux moechotypicola]|uniref:Signal peptidase I n=1 Tax=Herbiconiux moechotypicola TaxID=637393 RepID=A0ABN3DQZ3_9MICO|nr:signal peptidase I [Herbiconiux moechotypicola]MCS5731492.1 signal peptidase I [Herbiconiux moechotypicola]